MSEFTEAQKTFMSELFGQINNTVNIKISEIAVELKAKTDEIKEEINNSLFKYEEKVRALEEENQILRKNITQLQRKVRKNNIVIFGITEVQSDIASQVTECLSHKLQLEISNCDINDAYVIGRSNLKNKPILIEFISYQKKQEILKNARKLKGTSISISQDLSHEDLVNDRLLRKYMKEARSKGIEAYIKGTKLYIDSKPYTLEDLQKGECVKGASFIPTIEKIANVHAQSTSSAGQKNFVQNIDLEEELRTAKATVDKHQGNSTKSLIKTRSQATSR